MNDTEVQLAMAEAYLSVVLCALTDIATSSTLDNVMHEAMAAAVKARDDRLASREWR